VNGDKVSVLLPTASDKLLFQWKGPAVITERRGLVNYRVKFESGEEKTFHINMLKKYNEREDLVKFPYVFSFRIFGDLENYTFSETLGRY